MKKGFLRQHYHWVVFAVLFIGFFCTIGLENVRSSSFLIPVCEAFGITRGVFALATSIKCIVAVFSNMAFGFLYHKFGYRKMATVGILIVAFSFVLSGLAGNIYVFYVAAAVMGSAECCVTFALTSRVIAEWFNRSRGLILGIVMAGSGLGGSVFSLLFNNVIERSGYKPAYYLGAAFLAAAALLVLFFGRDDPASMGLEPFGGKNAFVGKKKGSVPYKGIPIGYLRSKPVFYLSLASVFLMALGVYCMLSIISPHVRDQGLSPTFAATAQSVAFFAMAGAKVLEGALCDRFGARRVLTVCLLLGVAGEFLFARAFSSWLIILSVLLYAFAISIPAVMVPLYAEDLFGSLDYSVILGLFFSMISFNNIIVSPLTNFSYDLLGSYSAALTVASACLLVSSLLIQLVYGRVKALREAYEAEYAAEHSPKEGSV